MSVRYSFCKQTNEVHLPSSPNMTKKIRQISFSCKGRRPRNKKTKGVAENQPNVWLCKAESRKPGFLDKNSYVHTPLDLHQNYAESAIRPTRLLRFNCDSPSFHYEHNVTPGWASMGPSEPPKTPLEFDFYVHPYPTFVCDIDAFPDPAFKRKWCGSVSATQLDYLYIKKTKNNIVW